MAGAWCAAAGMLGLAPARAQEAAPAAPAGVPAPRVPPEGSGVVRRQRPTVARPAEFQEAGFEVPGSLALELGYEAYFRGSEARREEGTPLTLRFAVTRRLLLQADFDALAARTGLGGKQVVGTGDLRLGLQGLAQPGRGRRPAAAGAYFVKLPTAGGGIGSGRIDHKLLALVSRELGEVEADFNLGYLASGRPGGGWESGAHGALSFAWEPEARGFGWEAELSAQTLDDEQPRGGFATAALTYKVGPRGIYDAGIRCGLTRGAPPLGLFAGLSVGFDDLFQPVPEDE